ncbi:DNA-binding transcriptional regulator, Lrp family [Modestobacter sp. DSM 44400]|uniref:Lrp/AsnC family transcriptional regulator n=1 Tax=Modestobacter sp. DSM 44400 TaxID=1550230 RepID=UPI0008980F5D|nr:Lrp/AsnC family transcriptional regulator [Modestobacter sp. DSM 44400]SDY27613.1 DNA-binding transcriptional regulator, Lrp family [Modestobacter sp. DSM 44400]
MLSDDDRALIGALQISPRASWSDVGEALGISGVTAARRWRRITSDGTAWVTAAPGMTRWAQQCLAYVEIDCAPAKRQEVASELARHEFVVTVEITTGSADILLTIAAADLATLSHYLLDHIGTMPSILRTRVRVATKIYTEGSSWRLVELDGPGQRVLERSRPAVDPSVVGADTVTLTPDVQQIARLLSVDGRASLAELAEATGISPTTVRRHVHRLLGARILLPRTDMAAELSGTPVQVYLWAEAPVDGLPATARTLTQLRQVRLCATVSSATSLVFCAWLHTVEEVHRLELTIAKQLPQLRIMDRLIVLRTVKRMGRLVDHRGRAVGVVPIAIWGDSREDPHQHANDAADGLATRQGGEGFRQIGY